jgi:hypothetical protein
MDRRPIIFLDMDDVLVISREYTSFQVLAIFKLGDLDSWPELWTGLIFAEARANLWTLHQEFWPQYVISSSWANYLSRKQMQELFRRTNLEFIADNLHEGWTTPKSEGASRTDEIEGWLRKYRESSQPLLVIDDDNSGWSLLDSFFGRQDLVVLCKPWIGFVADKLAEAQRLLQIQVNGV